MTDHPVRTLIEAADRAITAEDFDTLMGFYTEDAVLVVAPGIVARGKQALRKAFIAIAAHFNNSVRVSQGEMKVVEAGDTALVIMETLLDTTNADGTCKQEIRRATYVFRKDAAGDWLCAIDNSYGTGILDEGWNI